MEIWPDQWKFLEIGRFPIRRRNGKIEVPPLLAIQRISRRCPGKGHLGALDGESDDKYAMKLESEDGCDGRDSAVI